MTKIPRKTQKIFASSAGNRQLTAFGTAMTDNPVFTNDPALIQNNAYNYGWEAALTADKAPYEEDTNALLSMITQQLAYLYQMGTPEYDEETEYYKGSIVLSTDGSGIWYKSIADNNIGNALTDSSYWQTVSLGKQGMPLFTKTIQDHVLQGEDAIGWALQGSLVDGNVYSSAYNKLLDLYNQGISVNYRGISCIRTTDGRYIAPLTRKTSIDSLFNSSGIADFYILDTSNQSFYLPKNSKFLQFTTSTSAINQYVAAGLPSISVNAQTVTTSSAGVHTHGFLGINQTGWFKGLERKSGTNGVETVDGTIFKSPNISYTSGSGGGSSQSVWWQADFSYTPEGEIVSNGGHTHTVSIAASSNSSGIYGNSSTVQPTASYNLLYYLVGETAI